MVSRFLKRYGLALNRYKWPCLASFLGVAGIATAVALQPPPIPKYQASGILVQNIPPPEDNSEGNTTASPAGQVVVSARSLLSDELLQTVSQTLADRHILIDPKTLRQRTAVEFGEDTGPMQQIAVTFTWHDSDQAQVVLEQMFQSAVELSLQRNQAQLQMIITALEQQLPEIEATLIAAEDALQKYDRETGLAIQTAQDGSLLEAISAAQEQQRQNEIALAALDSQIQSLERQLGLSPEEALTASALSADPVIVQLRSQILDAETQLAILSPTLRQDHPTVQGLNTHLAAYNHLLEQRAAEVVGGNGLAAFANVSQIRQRSALDPARTDLANQLVALHNERQAIQQQQQVLAQSTARLTGQYTTLPNLQLERARKVQQIELHRALYDQIQAKRIDAQAVKAETLSSLAIAEPPATALQHQTVLPPALVMVIGSLLGVVLAATLAYLFDRLDGTVRIPEEIQGILSDLSVTLLGQVPPLAPAVRGELPILTQANLPYQGLRNAIKQRGNPATHGNGSQVILITSIGAGEGKTTTAFNLAIASAQAGRQTLIIEVDLHQMSDSHCLGVYSAPVPITEPQQYYARQDPDPVQPVPSIDNLFITPSPGPQKNTAAILESEEMTQFLATARMRYDLVVLDAPSLNLSSNDALALEHATDGVLLVTRVGHMKKVELKTKLDQLLHRQNLKILGAVINDSKVNQ